MNFVTSNVQSTSVAAHSFRLHSNRQSRVKLNSVVIPPAHNRKGTNADSGKYQNAAEIRMISSVFAASKSKKNADRSKLISAAKLNDHKLVTKRVPQGPITLPAILTADDSPVLKAIDALDWGIVHGKNAKPAFTAAILTVRANIKSACRAYLPVPVENMYAAGVDNNFPALADRQGLLCASGTPGYALFRGRLCTKSCRVACTETDKAAGPTAIGFVSIDMLIAANKIAPEMHN